MKLSEIHFNKFQKANIDFNEHTQASFFKTSTNWTDEDSTINSISKGKGSLIILFFNSASKSIQFLHSISDIGSTNWSPHPILTAIDGFKTDKAIPVLIDIDSLFKDLSCHALTFTRLSVITNKAAFDSTKAPDNNHPPFNHLPFIILLPPFLWSLSSLDDESPSNVVLKSIKTIHAFINNNKENRKLNSITKNTCSNLLTFLWAASRNKIKSINILPSRDNFLLARAWLVNCHTLCIEQNTHEPIQNTSVTASSIIDRISSVVNFLQNFFLHPRHLRQERFQETPQVCPKPSTKCFCPEQQDISKNLYILRGPLQPGYCRGNTLVKVTST